MMDELSSFALVSIPMFVLIGAAIASSAAGRDLYESLDRWLDRVLGGLVIANMGACGCSRRLRIDPRDCRRHRQDGGPGDAAARRSASIATGSIALAARSAS